MAVQGDSFATETLKGKGIGEMLFNSVNFLIFFPLVCLGYYLIPGRVRWRNLFLLAASYYFYMCWNPRYALLMLASTVITYMSGILIGWAETLEAERRRTFWKKAFVAASFFLNLSILFFFKYFNWAVLSINKILSTVHMTPLAIRFDIILPVGISFYTFQALSYTMDVYRGEIYPEKNFPEYALFVSFFPQLVAGPNERSGNLLRQLQTEHRFDFANVHQGLVQMLFGFFQKVVIADNVSVFVKTVYGNYMNKGSVELIVASVLFAVQIYCDFGGYSNIAIGAARVMGIRLMENFNTPYLSDSIADFWRRWHISLNTWFRDYVYIPLGGNRKGRLRKYINLMIVFLTSGLWHGAAWHFVAWGGINGLYQIAGDLLKPLRDSFCRVFRVDRQSFSHRFGKILITFFLVDVSWVFFGANSIRDALMILWRMGTRWNPWVLFDGGLFQQGLSAGQMYMLLAAILVLVLTDVLKYLQIDWMKGLCRQGIWFQYLVCAVFLGWILLCGSYGPGYDAAQFIYFQF